VGVGVSVDLEVRNNAVTALALFFVLTFAFLIAFDLPVLASDSLGQTVHVRVEDALSKHPVPFAHVVLESDSTKIDGFTDEGGDVTFLVHENGRYHLIVTATGFRFSAAVAVISGRPLNLVSYGVNNRLRTISTVDSQTTKRAPSSEITSSAPEASIAGGVGPALSSLPSLTSVGALTAMSIHGAPATTTGVSVNGAPVFAPGSVMGGLLNADVFASADVSDAAAVGASSGSLNLQTFEPTIDFQGLASERVSAYGGDLFSTQVRGTAGVVGIAVTNSRNIVGDPSDGSFFTDTSGSAYAHAFDSSSGGTTATLRYPVSDDDVISFDAGQFAQTTPYACRLLSGPLPCGYGPGNTIENTATYEQIRQSLLFDRATLDIHAFHSMLSNNFDFGGEAFLSRDSDRRSGLTAAYTTLLSPARTASLQLSWLNDQTSAPAAVPETELLPVAQSATMFEGIASIPIIATKRFKFNTTTGANAIGPTTHAIIGADASYTNSAGIATFSYKSGTLSNGTSSSFDALSPASELEVDCERDEALGNGPIAPTQPSASRNARLSWSERIPTGTVSAAAYYDVSFGSPVTGIVPGTALQGLLSPLYLGEADAVGSNDCYRPLNATPARLSFTVVGPAERSWDEGIDASYRAQFGRTVALNAQLNLTTAHATGVGPLFASGSTIANGAALLQIPEIRGDASVSWAMSPLTGMLLHLEYVGTNNAYGGTPFLDADVGLRFKTNNGDFVVAMQNAGNARYSSFSRFDPFPIIAQQYVPRSASVRYRLAFGQLTVDHAADLSAPLPSTSAIFIIPRPIGSDAMTTWLSPATDMPFCGPEDLAIARPVLAAIQSYADAVGASLAHGQDPPLIKPRTVGGIMLDYVRTADTFSIRIELPAQSLREASPFLRCARVHVGSYDDFKRLGLFEPGFEERTAQRELFFSPSVGIYAAAQPSNGNTITATGPIPARGPFVVNPKTCPTSYVTAITTLAGELQQHIDALYSGHRPPNIPEARVVEHTGRLGRWLEILFNDRALGEAVRACLDVPATTESAVNKDGYGGAILPSINYAPGLNLYVLRQ
jgi:hypothetical protein